MKLGSFPERRQHVDGERLRWPRRKTLLEWVLARKERKRERKRKVEDQHENFLTCALTNFTLSVTTFRLYGDSEQQTTTVRKLCVSG
jgi:hypothetical protein